METAHEQASSPAQIKSMIKKESKHACQQEIDDDTSHIRPLLKYVR
jgi:hypothetical protein